MIEGPISQDETFRRIRTGDEYVVMHGNSDGDDDTETTLKTGDGSDVNYECDGKGWGPAIVYYSMDLPGKTFVRDEATFRIKFERVE